MLYVTGDTHANQRKWAEQIAPVLQPGDTLIVCGDFGVGFWNGRYWSEELFYDYIAQQDYTVLFVDGNHENFDRLEQYPVVHWHGGQVHQLRPNLLHLMRGELYTLEGLRLFTFGGGYSMDKAWRTPGRSWWPQEMPTEAEYENGRQKLRQAGQQVDFILTHTAPSESVAYLAQCERDIKGSLPEEWPLNCYLDRIQQETQYRHWYFGHFHVDRDLWRDQTALLSCIRELESGQVVRMWARYEG